ncbi:MAG: hypothetical protein EOO50_04650 [Flavobacterium sp.]|uniref:hypothetical protein n=1 Tax=Flavobacterium sp. TaxID=239 RepID=UPI0011FB17E7|nr:hypothetical protein [Flavobacterium sp.]RZJ67577.1 MAG: hypothetical protein EOO50_04650 [Flavobacterium sp.]
MKPFDLENHPRIEPGFKAPENYFDDFEDRMFEKLETREVKVVPLFKKYRVAVYAAAAVLLLALLIPLFNSVSQPTELDDATIENYLAYQSGINQFDLLTVLEPQDIEELKTEIPVADEAIEDYLSTSDIENIIID